jgi:hypothetical protein
MRATLALLVTFIALVGAVRADSPRRTATVDIDGVEVRSGHAHSFAAVGQLRKGDTVIVIREEETGFLAIIPPTGAVSWIKQIHLGKVEAGDNGKANVPVAVEGAEVMAGSDPLSKPTNRVTTRLPKGTIVEIVGQPVRVDNSSWYPITPPEGDLRWIPKSALRAASLAALAPPPPYRPDAPAFTVAGAPGARADGVTRPAVASLPKDLTDHRLWSQASQAEKSGDYSTARSLYARMYQDLWDQKAERDAIVICYNRYTRCDEMVKKGDGVPGVPVSRTDPKTGSGAPAPVGAGKWSNPGYLQELAKVYVDGQQVFSLQDDRGNVLYYVTAVTGINLKNYNGKRVQVYGSVAQRPELYRPHMAVERVEVAK